MTINEAISRAIEGGYKEEETWDWDGPALPKILLDPSFWQCLGKAMGWYPKEIKLGEKWNMEEWKNVWHRLIDYLARGKSIGSFFETL